MCDSDINYNGFVYIWYDRKRKWFYIGSHYGNTDDGYVCSNKRMLNAYIKRPKDFKRKILEYVIGNPKDVFDVENKWLKMIDDKELQLKENKEANSIRYYNSKKYALGVDSYTASKLRSQWWNSDESDAWRQKLSERMRGNTFSKDKTPWNKGIKVPEQTKRNIEYWKDNDDMRNRYSKLAKERWRNGVYDNSFKNRGPLKEETKRKISIAGKGRKQTEYQKKIAREINLGKKASIETREKISKKAKEYNSKIVICPHCNLSGNGPVMKRWHFSNCKYKQD